MGAKTMVALMAASPMLFVACEDSRTEQEKRDAAAWDRHARNVAREYPEWSFAQKQAEIRRRVRLESARLLTPQPRGVSQPDRKVKTLVERLQIGKAFADERRLANAANGDNEKEISSRLHWFASSHGCTVAEAMQFEREYQATQGAEGRDVLGSWATSAFDLDSVVVLYRQGKALFVEERFSDKSAVSRSVKESASPRGRLFTRTDGERGYWLATNSGELEVVDPDGEFLVGTPIR